MCKYCDAGTMLRSSNVELPGGHNAAMALWITWRKEGTPIIRAKIDYGTKDKNFRGYAASRIPACSVEIKYCPFCGKKLLKDPIFSANGRRKCNRNRKRPRTWPGNLILVQIGIWLLGCRQQKP